MIRSGSRCGSHRRRQAAAEAAAEVGSFLTPFQLRVAPRFAGSLVDQIGRFTTDDLARVSRLLLAADIELKSTAMDPKAALERFFVEACGEPSRT